MKQAARGTQIVNDEAGRPWCIFLESDSHAEHQSGIDRLLHQLSIRSRGRYVSGRSMTEPRTLLTKKARSTRTYLTRSEGRIRRTDNILFLASVRCDLSTASSRLNDIVRYDIDTAITGAWDDGDFKVAAWTPEAHDILRAFAAAAERGDLTVFTGHPPCTSDNPFRHSGLNICITSRIPRFMREKIEAEDANAEALAQAVAECGIVERIDACPHVGYYALTPNWRLNTVLRDGKDVPARTVHPVMFHLNPHDRARNNHGWHTVEELDEWIAGKGPIPKVKEYA